MLPKALDPQTLRTIALVVLAVLAVLAFVVVRIAQKVVLRVVLLGFLGGLAVFVWLQRSELQRCVPSCDCSLAGHTVQVPGCNDQ